MTRKRRRTGGYTVLEVLIVLGIIALIGAVVAPRLIGYLGRAKSQTTVMQIDNLHSAVDLFFVDTGRYPTASEGLGALMERPRDTPRWDGPYLDSAEALTDPWQRAYLYAPAPDGRSFEIRSLGRDGLEGGEGEDADLSN